ncbi:hypothetical protein FOZ61_006351 [Perkinsus olseni]|uniref:NADH:ubiquinone reductase (non-electrogenic) n=1 Tax=Perkinsus olseni TaxID=32597 RepID=A0A7J6LED7_PEROL|nr:hypothetical protein FOZ61_006351 [Perkinsus olseni]
MGVPGVLEYTHFLKEMDHARLIRKNVLDSFETACTATSDERKRELLHFVVVGGGPTGVEFAAELRDFIREEISQAYWEVAHLAKVSVIQSAENILNTFDAAISRYATDHFKRIDIEVVKNSRVKAVDASAVVVQDMATQEERRIPFGVCVWAAGIAPRPFTKDLISQLKGCQPENGRLLKTTPYLEVLGGKGDLFAIGDCAGVAEPELLSLAESLFDEADINQDGKISFEEYKVIYRKIRERFPLLQGAGPEERWKHHADTYNDGKPLEYLTHDLWEKVFRKSRTGEWLAEYLSGRTTTPFERNDKGMMSYVGGSRAVVQSPLAGNITGVSTFALWRGVYASKMVSWRCRHLVIWDWIKAHMYGRDLSKITSQPRKRQSDYDYARRLQAQEYSRLEGPGGRSSGRTSWGSGRPTGNGYNTLEMTAEEKRQAAAEAAERRMKENQGRGLGSSEKAAQMTEAAKKQELIGRIREYYAARRLDPPLGLNLASVDQLRKHLDLLKSGKIDPASAVLENSV